MLLLTKSDVQKSVNMDEVINIVEQAFIAYSRKETDVPVRTQISIPHENAVALYMPGYVRHQDALGVKIVSVFPENLSRKMATISSVLVMNDAVTGEPMVAMEASYLTALRTGAASGVATRYLAREEASSVAVIGTGVQARTQLEAVCCVRTIQQVMVFDINRASAQQYVNDMKALSLYSDIEFIITETPDKAVEGADIICTTTTSKVPVFSAKSLKKGAHINAVGAFTPEMQEIGEDVLAAAGKVCVDSLEAALEEAGDLMIPIQKGVFSQNDIFGEIGEIAAGQKVSRENDEEITLFKTVGLSVQDVSVGKHVLKKATEKGLGTDFNFMG